MQAGSSGKTELKDLYSFIFVMVFRLRANGAEPQPVLTKTTGQSYRADLFRLSAFLWQGRCRWSCEPPIAGG